MDKGKQSGRFRRFYRIFRWCALIALIAVISLAIRRPGDVPEAPDPVKVPEQARQFESKLQQLEEAGNRRDSGVQENFPAAEVNAFLAQSVATQGEAPAHLTTPSSQTQPVPLPTAG